MTLKLTYADGETEILSGIIECDLGKYAQTIRGPKGTGNYRRPYGSPLVRVETVEESVQ